MRETDGELVRERIRDLWENTDFTSTLFGSLTGYAVIAAQVEAVPEPSTFLVFGAGLAGWLVLGRRSRSAGRRSPAF